MQILYKVWDGVWQVLRFWPSVVGSSFIWGIVGSVGTVGYDVMIHLIQWWLAIYKYGEIVSFEDYYGAHYFEATRLGFLIFFTISILYFASQKYRRKEIESSRMALDGLDFVPVSFDDANGVDTVGLRIHNKKPVDITSVTMQISQLWVDNEKHPQEFISLAWVDARFLLSTYEKERIDSKKKEICAVAQIVGGRARLAILPNIYTETEYTSGKEVVKREDKTNYIFLEPNKRYKITIRMLATLIENSQAKAFHVYTGILVYDGSTIHFKKVRPPTVKELYDQEN